MPAGHGAERRDEDAERQAMCQGDAQEARRPGGRRIVDEHHGTSADEEEQERSDRFGGQWRPVLAIHLNPPLPQS